MKITPRFLIRPSLRERGVALIIVLSFIVLLTGLIVAFFSRAITDRQLSDSSLRQARADSLARSAMAIITGDLRQEIVNGSDSPITAGNSKLYFPKSNAYMIPIRSGNPGSPPFTTANPDPIPNLIRRSVRTETGTGPLVPSKASAVNSETDPSANGRTISKARWNKHYLIPRFDKDTTIDTTPDVLSGFVAPDWVFVTDKGPEVIAVPSTTVRGRYAFAIYDEGGLLDLNAAGFPADTTAGGPNGLSSAQRSQKTALPLADLSRLPTNKAGTTFLPQDQVNNLVGWRNYVSANLTATNGGFATFTFDSSTATQWLNNFVNNNTNGYMKVYSGVSSSPVRTDQAFISRQQLIAMRSALGFSQNALQYLTHFSRALDQPSFVPNSDQPNIIGSGIPPANASAYQGNNSYFGGESSINMKGVGGFLSVRVKTAFTRADGSTAVIGEPLVKRRFALSNLSRITTTATAAPVSSDPIYSRFGIYRVNASSPWIYNHGQTSIMTLAQVSALSVANAREPDFAELLKAAINAGSVGKGAYTNQGNNYSYNTDVSGDRQILQIMANLIDQTKTDNYPTVIKPFDNDATTLPVFGVQDLPYFYNYHFYGVTTKRPSPLLSNADTVPKSTLDISKVGTADHIRQTILTDPGAASYFIIPQVWRPHDANTPIPTGGGPSVFRVVFETTDPTGTLGYWKISASPEMIGQSFDGANDIVAAKPPASAKSTATQLDTTNGWLQFTDSSSGNAFREPTLLWRNGIPAGVSLSGTSRTEDSSLTGKTYYGILVGDTKVSWSATINGADYVCQTSSMQLGASISGPSGTINDNGTFRMQYFDSSGNWITYQNVFVDAELQDIHSYSLFVNAADSINADNKWANPLQQTFGGGSAPIVPRGGALTVPRGGPYDPRGSRFGNPVRGFFDNDDPTLNGNPTLDAVTMKNNSLSGLSAGENQAVAASNFVLMKTQRPTTARGQNYDYTNPSGSFAAQQRFYSSADFNAGGSFNGLLSQNNPAVNFNGGTQNYYEDPDGVCRRAMGGYVPVSGASAGRLTNTTTTVGLPLATASTGFANGLGAPTTQSQSRPIILHRPFKNVGEMSYAFRGSPWKNIDFFTPESGDAALLDVFCINEPPPDALVAGKVNLNTRQAPVLQAILSGAYRDEFGSLPPLSTTETQKISTLLLNFTTGAQPWQGPLGNVSELVGRYVSPNPGAVSGADVYQYTSPGSNATYTYSGLSSALSGVAGAQDGSDVWSASPSSSRNIQRFREAPIRALASVGQTRVWNLMIDVVAQTGRFTANANALSQFVVEGEKRYWVHVAIDRFTGKVIDQQFELVTE